MKKKKIELVKRIGELITEEIKKDCFSCIYHDGRIDEKGFMYCSKWGNKKGKWKGCWQQGLIYLCGAYVQTEESRIIRKGW